MQLFFLFFLFFFCFCFFVCLFLFFVSEPFSSLNFKWKSFVFAVFNRNIYKHQSLVSLYQFTFISWFKKEKGVLV